jgi:hypothetical protein
MSPSASEDNSLMKNTEESKETQKFIKSTRYDRIEEEDSYPGSGNDSEITESVRMTKDDRKYDLKQEFTLYGHSSGPENFPK